MIAPRHDSSCVAITGATGLLGHSVLAALLGRQVRCLAVVRPPVHRALARLNRLLEQHGLDTAAMLRDERLIIVAGDTVDGLPPAPAAGIRAIVHAAGSTRFAADRHGEPHRTNVLGTMRLLEWAAMHGIDEFHHVSTAFVGGRGRGPFAEQTSRRPPAFHNDYERSKWEAEMACAAWRRAGTKRRLTIYRPSIIVGDSVHGRTTAFNGFYLLLRAADTIARLAGQDPRLERYAMPLRVRARHDGAVNIVPVDYVASMIAGAVTLARPPRGVFHLVHPRPPRHDLVQTVIESAFDIGGGEIVPPAFTGRGGDDGFISDIDRAFGTMIESIGPYLIDAPEFARRRCRALERRLAVQCPTIDEAFLHRLIRYGRDTRWGRAPRRRTVLDEQCAAYFERFLPARLPESQVARVHGLNATVRFIIEDIARGQWVCRFENGQLAHMHRGVNGLREDFAYRTSRRAFWRIVSGDSDPQEVFLAGHADVTGDAEKALKMAVNLNAFSREFPCRPEQLGSSIEEAPA